MELGAETLYAEIWQPYYRKGPNVVRIPQELPT